LSDLALFEVNQFSLAHVTAWEWYTRMSFCNNVELPL
jgi:hypothetical protein